MIYAFSVLLDELHLPLEVLDHVSKAIELFVDFMPLGIKFLKLTNLRILLKAADYGVFLTDFELLVLDLALHLQEEGSLGLGWKDTSTPSFI